MIEYRPAGYGQRPSPATQALAPFWWVRDGNGGLHFVTATDPVGSFTILWTGAPESVPGTPPWSAALWCALGTDGIPCAIGTPPKSWVEELDEKVATLRPLGLSVRAANVLMGLGTITPQQIAGLSARDVLRAHHAGQKTLDEIRAMLAARGLALRGEERPPETERERLLRELVEARRSSALFEAVVTDEASPEVHGEFESGLQFWLRACALADHLIAEDDRPPRTKLALGEDGFTT